MGCTSCGTDKSKPGGCQSNGGCGTGSCNRLNVHDWLANLPFSDPEGSCRVIEVTFNNGSRKDFYRNNTLQVFMKDEIIAVEGVNGFDVGTVSLTGELVRLQLKKKRVHEDSSDIRKVLRLATDSDIQKWKENKAREKDAMIRSRAISRQLKLNMKLCEVEIQADGRKATFFYISDERVDFRELIKIFASEFKVKVEMKQIGARQESAKVGGIGSCGRELCCSSWLTEFKSVTTTIARYQNLSINQTKLSGQCGRLKCCLNYELDTYLDALQGFPQQAEMLDTVKGIIRPTPAGSCFSAAVASDGSYGIEPGLIVGFPLTSDGQTVSIIRGQKHSEFAQSKIDITINELRDERECVKDLLV